MEIHMKLQIASFIFMRLFFGIFGNGVQIHLGILKAMYRNSDYDIEYDRFSISSFPEGLKEDYRFLPYIGSTVRRTNSHDDIARFYRCFKLAQSNQGTGFKWRHYIHLIQDSVKDFKFSNAYQRLSSRVPSSTSDFSYVTARTTSTPRGLFMFGKKCASKSPRSSPEVGKSSSSFSLTMGPHVLKVCKDTKNLAKDIYKKMETISNLQNLRSRKNSKERNRHHVKTVERIGDAFSPRYGGSSLQSTEESTDNDTGSTTPSSRGAAGDRRRRLLARSGLCR